MEVDQETVNRAIKQAEQMVSEVPDINTKAAAFGVLFSRFLEGAPVEAHAQRGGPVVARTKRATGATASARSLGLRGEGFFAKQRSLAEVRDELGARGWHYPLTALSGVMQSLVRARELRRAQVRVGSREVWQYSNH
jgi:hypothetical protein